MRQVRSPTCHTSFAVISRTICEKSQRAAGKTCTLLLVTIGGGTPEPAAIRGDAGPDRTATGADGIEREWSSLHRNRSYQRLGEEECRRSTLQNKAMSAMLARIADRWGASAENRFKMSRTGEMRVQWCRFRGQKGNSRLITEWCLRVDG